MEIFVNFDIKAYDRVIEQTPSLGGLGVFQWRLMLLVGVACSGQALHLLNTIFTMVEQENRCAVPGLPNDTYRIQSEAHWRMLNTSVPYDTDKGDYSQCFRYQDNITETDGTISFFKNISSHPLQKCTQWVYNTDNFATSVVSEFSLVCERHMYSNHANMLTLAGLMAGSLFSGPLSDRFGRKKTFLLFNWIQFVTALALAFTPSMPVFLLLRFLVSTSGFASFMTSVILCMEVMSPRHRTLAGMMTNFGWTAGMLLLVLASYLVRSWRPLQIVLSAPLVLIAISYIWILPESPRWLLSKGRYSEAKAILCNMARVNKSELPDKLLLANMDDNSSPVSEDEKSKRDNQGVLLLLKSPVLVFRLLVVAFGWLVNSMVYYGLTLNVGSIIEGDIFLNFFIMTVMEIISYFMLILLARHSGRKPAFCVCVLLGGTACLATIFPLVMGGGSTVMMILSNLGRFFITSSFAILWIYSAELWPTPLRQSSVGVCSFMGRSGAIISPYIGRLHEIVLGPLGRVLPLLVFGVAALLSGIIAIFLPETVNRKLPETVEEAEKMSWRSKEQKKTEDSEKFTSC